MIPTLVNLWVKPSQASKHLLSLPYPYSRSYHRPQRSSQGQQSSSRRSPHRLLTLVWCTKSHNRTLGNAHRHPAHSRPGEWCYGESLTPQSTSISRDSGMMPTERHMQRQLNMLTAENQLTVKLELIPRCSTLGTVQFFLQARKTGC